MSPLRTLLTFIGGASCGVALMYFAVPQPASPDVPLPQVPSSPTPNLAENSVYEPMEDTRITFAVTEAERAHIKTQMLAFLTGIQELNDAIASSDRDWIGEVATRQATQRNPNGIGRQLRDKAPEGFTQISRSLRSDFSALADASASEPVEELQQRLSLVLSKCVACHGSYTVSQLPAD